MQEPSTGLNLTARFFMFSVTCTITVTEIVPSLRRQLRGSSHLQTSFSRDFLAAPDQSIDHVRVSTGPGESLLHFSGRPGRAGWLHGQCGREACGETHLGRGQRRMLSVSMDGATGSFDAHSTLSSRHPACRSCCFPWAIVFPSVRPVRCFPLACGVGSSASVRPSRDAAGQATHALSLTPMRSRTRVSKPRQLRFRCRRATDITTSARVSYCSS